MEQENLWILLRRRDVKKILNHIVKHSNRSLYFEWKQMKGRACNDKKWSMSSLADGVVGKKSVCGMWEG